MFSFSQGGKSPQGAGAGAGASKAPAKFLDHSSDSGSDDELTEIDSLWGGNAAAKDITPPQQVFRGTTDLKVLGDRLSRLSTTCSVSSTPLQKDCISALAEPEKPSPLSVAYTPPDLMESKLGTRKLSDTKGTSHKKSKK